MGEIINSGKSSAENLKEVAWVKEQTKEELNALTGSVEDNFFYTKEDDGSISYNMDLVKRYLDSLKDKNWTELKGKNTAAWIMAVQIALESMKDETWNAKYDVGMIDGFYGNKTREAVIKFQQDVWFTWEDVDGRAWTKTIHKILEILWWNITSANNEEKDKVKDWSEDWGNDRNDGGDSQQEDEDMIGNSNDPEITKKTPDFISDNITPEEMQSYVEAIKTQCEDELKISDEESLGLSFEGKNLLFSLGWTWLQKVDYVATTSYGQAISNTSEYLITEKVDVKTCLKWWDSESDEYGNVDIEYVKNKIIREVKEKIVNKKKATRWSQELVKKYKKDWLTLEDIFGRDSVLKNYSDRTKWRLNTFFNKFDSQKLIFDISCFPDSIFFPILSFVNSI